MAPDITSNGPSFLTALKVAGLITEKKAGVRMVALGDGISKITLGGIDKDQMLPYPTAENKTVYYYKNIHDDSEWGAEMRNIYVC